MKSIKLTLPAASRKFGCTLLGPALSERPEGKRLFFCCITWCHVAKGNVLKAQTQGCWQEVMPVHRFPMQIAVWSWLLQDEAFLLCSFCFPPKQAQSRTRAGAAMLLQTHPLSNFPGCMPSFTFWPNTVNSVSVSTHKTSTCSDVDSVKFVSINFYLNAHCNPCFKLAVTANSWSAVSARFVSKENIVKQGGDLLVCGVFFKSCCSVLDIDCF